MTVSVVELMYLSDACVELRQEMALFETVLMYILTDIY